MNAVYIELTLDMNKTVPDIVLTNEDCPAAFMCENEDEIEMMMSEGWWVGAT